MLDFQKRDRRFGGCEDNNGEHPTESAGVADGAVSEGVGGAGADESFGVVSEGADDERAGAPREGAQELDGADMSSSKGANDDERPASTGGD